MMLTIMTTSRKLVPHRGCNVENLFAFSAFSFLTWIHHIFFSRKSSLVGTYWGPRDQTIFDPLGRYLFHHGATVRTGAQLKVIRYEATGEGVGYVTGFGLENGEWLTGDFYVAAVPAWSLAPLIPDAMSLNPFFSNLNKLPVAPAISAPGEVANSGGANVRVPASDWSRAGRMDIAGYSLRQLHGVSSSWQ